MHLCDDHRGRQKRGARGTLELPTAHLAQQTDVLVAASDARREMRPCNSLLLLKRGSSRVRTDRPPTVLAHTARRADHRELIQLALGATCCRQDSLYRLPKSPRGTLDSAHTPP